MSCTACTKKYGLFCKELGCPNCNYSFCKNCLKKEIEVPKCGNRKLKVCLKCFEKLEKQKLVVGVDPATSDFARGKKALQTEELLLINDPEEVLAPVLEPIHTGEEALANNDDEEINKNLDSVITKRLASLKNTGIELPSDSEMAMRLANLKDIPHKEYSKADILLSKDVRSEQDQINDLLTQFVEENTIGKKLNLSSDPISEIEQRLANLRGETVQVKTGDPIKDSGIPDLSEESESTTVKKIIQQYIDEAKLPNALISEEEKELISGLPPPSKDTEELPFCLICNEDAIIRCLGCDGDLYCRSCFKECHDDEDFKEHKTEDYPKRPVFKEDHF